MPLTLEQYAQFLDTRDLSWPAAPTPAKVKARPHLVAMPQVRMVTWNIYGTLISIMDGELFFTHPQQFVMDLALEKTVQEFKMWGSMSRKPGQPSEYMGQIYRKVLDDQRLAPSPGEKYPEIQSERLWEAIVKKLLQKDYQFDASFYGSLNEFSRKIAYFFHASLQGTACYAGAAEALKYVKEYGLAQGLIADSQSFTLVQLQRGLAEQQSGTSVDALFDADLRALSHEQRARKPSEKLFRTVLQTAAERGIAPLQILHIGSRIAQDIAPARRLGLRTALFAGDKDALRATPEQLKDPATRPDALLTELTQIKQILGSR